MAATETALSVTFAFEDRTTRKVTVEPFNMEDSAVTGFKNRVKDCKDAFNGSYEGEDIQDYIDLKNNFVSDDGAICADIDSAEIVFTIRTQVYGGV